MVDILGTIAAFKDELLKAGGIIKDELEQYLDKGLQKYIVNYKDKFEKTKTFLFRDAQVDFYKIYFPLLLNYNYERIEVPKAIDELFEKNRCITILGIAGSGKTMLLKHCFLSCLTTSNQIPVVVELRKLNSYPGSLLDYIKEFVFKMDIAKNDNILERLLSLGKFTFFFDGFDEISLSLKERRVRELESFIDSYNNNFYLLTSRPDANSESLHRFENYKIENLTRNQVDEFIIKQSIFIEDGEDLSSKIIELIRKPENELYLNYLSNPLLLSMFILTFRNHPELPKRKNKFYYNVFDTLYSRHDTISKSGGYVHEKKTSLEKDVFEEVLRWFSYKTYFKGIYTFDRQILAEIFETIKNSKKIDYEIEDLIYDLSVSISILIKDGIYYTFPHRSLQEYFAAMLISRLPEEIKINIYADKTNGLIAKPSANLWSMCEELDEYCFTKFFLIKKLKNILLLLEKSSDGKITQEVIFNNFAKNFNYRVFLTKKEKSSVLRVTQNRIENSLMLEYLKIHPAQIFWIIKDWTPVCDYYVFNAIGEEVFFELKTIDEKSIDLFKKIGLIDEVYKIYKLIINKIEFLESKIKNEEAINNLLLDF